MNVENLEKELFCIIKNFDIPEYRMSQRTIHNYRWMHRNIGIRNSKREKYERAMKILEILIKEKK